MALQINDVSFLETDEPLKPVWLEYRDGFELLIEPSTAKEQRQELLKANGESVSRAKSLRYFRSKVKNWRNLEVGGKDYPFSREALRRFSDKDSNFQAFITTECQEILSNFLDGDGDGAAGSASPTGKSEASA